MPEIYGVIFAVFVLGVSCLFIEFILAMVESYPFQRTAHEVSEKGLISYFPITVIAAMTLFILKEIFEAIKKSNERKRKIRALKLLMAEEIELNYWVFKQIESLIRGVDENFKNIASVFRVKKSKAGVERFECEREDGGGWGQGFPAVRDDRYHKLAVEIASLDELFYGKLSNCYLSIAELKHFRDGVYSYIDEDGEKKELVGGFLSYVKSGLPKIYIDLNDLYLFCKGKNLETHRLR